MKTVTLHFSERLVRATVKAFWWRTTGWSYLLALGLMLLGFAYLLWSGDRSWLVGLLGAILGMGTVAAAALYIVHYEAAFNRFRRMRVPEAVMELAEDYFRVTSDVGTSEIRWEGVAKLWRFHDFWLLFFSSAQFMTLPTADLDVSAREFIVARLEAHTVKVA